MAPFFIGLFFLRAVFLCVLSIFRLCMTSCSFDGLHAVADGIQPGLCDRAAHSLSLKTCCDQRFDIHGFGRCCQGA